MRAVSSCYIQLNFQADPETPSQRARVPAPHKFTGLLEEIEATFQVQNLGGKVDIRYLDDEGEENMMCSESTYAGALMYAEESAKNLIVRVALRQILPKPVEPVKSVTV